MYSTGKAFGYCRWNGKRTSCSPQKDRIDKVVENANIKPVVKVGQQYLSEDMLYDFMLEAKTDKCKYYSSSLDESLLSYSPLMVSKKVIRN